MMLEVRLGLLPELLTLTESTETLTPPTDLVGLAEDGSGEGLEAERLSKEHFGSHSG